MKTNKTNTYFLFSFHVSSHSAILAGFCSFSRIDWKNSSYLGFSILVTERKSERTGGTLRSLLKLLLEVAYLMSAHIWSHKAGPVAKAKAFGAEMCDARTQGSE